jgi:nucleoside-diphosphate-sugar epimerase
VLLTGAQGYIGSVLGPILVERGHEVTGLDTGFYLDGESDDAGGQVPWVKEDVRRVSLASLRGFDAVVHLGELSNDPLGQLNSRVTYEVNYLGSVRLARFAKLAGVTRFVYSSSCSVYGVGTDDYRAEDSATRPQTAYAKCKLLVEQHVGELADLAFSPTFLRNATVYGPSLRMRFDLVLNNLAGLAWTTGRVALASDGTPWRPLVHVRDLCEAVVCVLDAPPELVHNETFNVGDTHENYTVRQIADFVSAAFPEARLSIGAKGTDNRSYRVSFEKIHRRLPGFRCRHDAAGGARELREMFERTRLTRDVFESRVFTRVEQIRHLLATGQLDERLFWVTPAEAQQMLAEQP